ncbi:ABC transporter ATP-binding protein [Anoxynatronum sibiricum]|uniref:ABC transporter ATP-binding protein n=1 Tax=Anoxynatronum sibiricum TaxID=210623 RepID=A0ABU9VST0_9CLOT
MAYLSIDNISMHFGGLVALDDVSIQVEPGEIVSIIGPNGAGKTTLFNVITGVYKPTGGSIHFENQPIHNKEPQEIVKAGIARTFQNIRLCKDMRVIENVLLGMHTHTDYHFWDVVFRTKKFKTIELEKHEEALRILTSIGLQDQIHNYATNLPYGAQRRLEISRAISTKAKIILLDEPAAGMNEFETDALLDFIMELKIQGFTIILIEHDMRLVMNISDRIYVIDHGKKIAEGLPKDIAKNPRVIEAYLGRKEENA